MMSIIYLQKFLRHPIKFTAYAVKKLITDPIKYRSDNGYDAKRYWEDRFKRYGFDNLTSTGNEGLSKEENISQYAKHAPIFKKLITKYMSDKRTCLEVGVGNGFYAQIMSELGVANYTGADITNVFFKDLSKKYPKYKFIQLDITENKLADKYDLILFMDVIEHIVNQEKLAQALSNLISMLNPNGILVISGFYDLEKSNQEFFYEMRWSFNDVDKNLRGLSKLCEPIDYRGDKIIFFQKT